MSEPAGNEREMMEALADLAKVSVSNLKKLFSSPPAGKTWGEIKDGLSRGENLKAICGVSDEYMEGAYAEARGRLEREDFTGAKDAFASLCLYDPQAPKHWGGLAKSCEGLKLHHEAADCYKMAALATGGSEPLPYLCMGYCHLAAGERPEAREALEMGMEIADPNDIAHRPLIRQMEQLLSACGN